MQPKTLEERQTIVKDFVARFHYTIPMVVDTLSNDAELQYAAWPERLYVIGADGKVIYKGAMGPSGYDPEEILPFLPSKAASR